MAFSIPCTVEIDGNAFTIEKRNSMQVPQPFLPEDVENLVVELCLRNGVKSRTVRKALQRREIEAMRRLEEKREAKQRHAKMREKKENDLLLQLQFNYRGRHITQHNDKLKALIDEASREDLENVLRRIPKEIEASPRFRSEDIEEFAKYLTNVLFIKKPSSNPPEKKKSIFSKITGK